MITLVSRYLKQCEGLVTVWLERWSSDVLFRSTVAVVGLLAGLTVVWTILFVALVVNHSSIWLALFAMALTSAIFGFLFFRFMLTPARNTLHYQKLFISNVAHELRTPLSTIKTSTEVGLLDETLSTSTTSTLREILTELNRISEIIDNLLSLNTLTRPERMRFGNIDLGSLLDMVVARHTPLANERQIAVVVQKEPPTIVWGNATALEQVVANLVKNALMYTQKNTKGRVILSLHPDHQGSIVFSVSDNGIGIAQHDLAHIFEPFYRADTSRVRNIKIAGSGLGLAIVNEIVRAHRGKIVVESARNQGTTVSVLLPLGMTRQIAPEIANPANTRNHVSVDFSRGLHGLLPKNMWRSRSH